MLDNKDITVLQGMFKEQDQRFLEAMKQNNQDLKEEIRDEMRALLGATETRIKSELGAKIDSVEKRITTDIAELLDTSVLPQIAELQRDMTKVKQHLQLA